MASIAPNWAASMQRFKHLAAPRHHRRPRPGRGAPAPAARCRRPGTRRARCRRGRAPPRAWRPDRAATRCRRCVWPSCHSHGSPTSTTLAVRVVSGRASRRATSSAPMPAGSPSVSATTGLACVHAQSSLMPRFLDDFGVALVLGVVKGGELRLCHRRHLGADGIQARLGVGQRQQLGDFGLHPILYRLGRRRGHVDAVPGAHLDALDSRLGHRRHLRQLRAALVRRDGDRAHLAALDVRQHRGHGVEAHLHLAAHQIDQRRRTAAVGNVGDEGAGRFLEQFGRDVLRAARAAGGVVQFAGLLPGQLDQLRPRSCTPRSLLTTSTFGTAPTKATGTRSLSLL